jgi:O-antigen/teichoic acid export membrane protein
MPETIEPAARALKGFLAGDVVRQWRKLKAAPPSDHGAQRWRRIFISTGFSLCSRAVAMGCALLTIPIALRYLGASRYGIWITLTSSVSMLSFFDFGIGIGLQNRVAEMMGRGRLDHAAKCLRSTLLVIAGISLLLFAILTVLLFATDSFAALFPSAHFGVVDIRAALLIILGAFVLGLPLGLFSRMALGLQQGWIPSIAQASGTAFSLVAVSIAALLGVNFTTFVAMTVIPPIAGQTVSYLLLSRRVPACVALIGPISLAEGFRTLRDGSHYVLPQIAGSIVTQGPLVLLGTVSSPVSAAAYGVLTRISMPFQQLQQMFLEQVWPAITESLHRGDTPWLRKNLRRLLKMVAAFSVLVLVTLIVAVEVLFPMLTRSTELDLSLPLVILYACHICVMCIIGVLAYVANGLGRMRPQNYFAVVSIAAVFTIFPAATARFGIEGVLVAMLALNSLVAAPLFFRDYARVFQEWKSTPPDGQYQPGL